MLGWVVWYGAFRGEMKVLTLSELDKVLVPTSVHGGNDIDT